MVWEVVSTTSLPDAAARTTLVSVPVAFGISFTTSSRSSAGASLLSRQAIVRVLSLY
jgi:hypothetical protein